MGGRPSELWPGLSWGRRLVWTQFAVLVTMSVTLVLTALEMGPPLFKKHMAEAGHTQPMVCWTMPSVPSMTPVRPPWDWDLPPR